MIVYMPTAIDYIDSIIIQVSEIATRMAGLTNSQREDVNWLLGKFDSELATLLGSLDD